MAPDRSEQLDDEQLGVEYPPERPLGAEEYGTTAQEERVAEPMDERGHRYEDDDSGAGEPDEVAPGLLDQGPEDDEKDLVADTDEQPNEGTPAYDTAADRVPRSAEEEAVHVIDEDDAGWR